ncbi:MAG: ankyrin repeat domain-containing protein, partial [Spirochaetes bacterium]|nr:ankyrin repeat domain-containing protein [Spirochaetota bacterium]
SGATALMTAASYGCYDAASFLLEHGADPASVNNQGKSAAGIARENRYDDIAGLIEKWEKGAR